MKMVKLPISAFTVLAGKHTKADRNGDESRIGTEYTFVTLEKSVSNDNAFITQMKEAGVKVVDTNGGGVATPFEIVTE